MGPLIFFAVLAFYVGMRLIVFKTLFIQRFIGVMLVALSVDVALHVYFFMNMN